MSSSLSALDRPIVELDTELLGLHGHTGLATEIRHQHPRVVAHDLGIDVLVGRSPGPPQRRGVQPALVGEGRHADERVGGLGRKVHQLGDVVAHERQPLHPALGQRGDAQLQREIGDHRHQVGVARALAVAVDRALHLPRTTDHGSHRVRDGTTAVVLGVDPDDRTAGEERHDLAA